MSQKAMVFIDGSWFYHSRQILFELRDEAGFEIDYRRLPQLVGDCIAKRLGIRLDVVRTFYFGTLPLNKAGYNPAKQRAFYQFLQQNCGYEVEVLEMDHRLEHGLSDDRPVGVALSAAMMHYASLSGAYDVGILMGGSSDYRPLLRRVRERGKRTALVAMNNGENRQVTSSVLLEDHSLFDVAPVFLDDYIDELRLVRRPVARVCKACGREEETTWDKDYFFCSECRKEFKKIGGERGEEDTLKI